MGCNKISVERKALAEQAAALRATGMSYKAIGLQLNLPTSTAERYCKLNPYGVQGPNIDSASNTQELEVARALLKRALDEGQPFKVCQDLLQTIDRLVRNGVRNDLVTKNLITRSEALTLCEAMVNAVVEAFRDVPGFEDRIDRVLGALEWHRVYRPPDAETRRIGAE